MSHGPVRPLIWKLVPVRLPEFKKWLIGAPPLLEITVDSGGIMHRMLIASSRFQRWLDEGDSSKLRTHYVGPTLFKVLFGYREICNQLLGVLLIRICSSCYAIKYELHHTLVIAIGVLGSPRFSHISKSLVICSN